MPECLHRSPYCAVALKGKAFHSDTNGNEREERCSISVSLTVESIASMLKNFDFQLSRYSSAIARNVKSPDSFNQITQWSIAKRPSLSVPRPVNHCVRSRQYAFMQGTDEVNSGARLLDDTYEWDTSGELAAMVIYANTQQYESQAFHVLCLRRHLRHRRAFRARGHCK